MTAVRLDLPKDLEVIKALLRRRDAGKPPGYHDDGMHIAIVVGGGGMRGGATGGMVLALEEAGLTGCFDSAYGSSAGAFIAAAMIHGQGVSASRVFPDDMSQRAFLDLRRMASRAPVMSLDHLLDEILTHSKPMDWEYAMGHDIPLNIIATNLGTMEAEVLRDLRTVDDWKAAFRATSAVPGFSGGPVELRGQRYIDGTVAEPLPAMRAIEDGATHVLALIARSEQELTSSGTSSFYSRAELRALNAISSGLGSMMQGKELYEHEISRLAASGRPVYVLANPISCGVRSMTRDVAKIERSVGLGRLTAEAALWRAAQARRPRWPIEPMLAPATLLPSTPPPVQSADPEP